MDGLYTFYSINYTCVCVYVFNMLYLYVNICIGDSDIQIISLVLEAHSMELQIVDEVFTKPWLDALRLCVLFLQIPVH